MSPEEAQELTNLRMLILQNERDGKPSHEGIDPARLAKAVDTIRAKAAVGAALGGKEAAKKKATAAKKDDAGSSLAAKLAAKGLDFS